MVTDTFRVPHGLMTTGTKLQKASAILIIITDISQSARPAYAYAAQARFLFVISSRGVPQHEI